MEKISELKSSYIQHSDRLQQVRKEKTVKQNLHLYDQYVELGDAYSEYGSQSSRSSSTRSSK